MQLFLLLPTMNKTKVIPMSSKSLKKNPGGIVNSSVSKAQRWWSSTYFTFESWPSYDYKYSKILKMIQYSILNPGTPQFQGKVG